MNLPDGGDAVGARHHQIHQNHVGLDQAAAQHSLIAVFGFAHQFQIGHNLQESAQAAAHDGMIVHHHHSNLRLITHHVHSPTRLS